MKLQYILFLLLTGCLASCENLLDLKPENSVTFGNAFETEKDVEAALLNTENKVRLALAGGLDNPLHRGSYSDHHEKNSFELLEYPGWDLYAVHIGWHYEVINSANVVLPFLNGVNMPQERKDFYKGAMYFYKALAYLELIRQFGDMPLVKDEPVLGPIGRTPWPELADYAISLVKEAIRLLPEWDGLTDWQGNRYENRDRACRGAAYAVWAHLAAWKAGCKPLTEPQYRNYDEMYYWRMVDTACTAIINQKSIYDLEATPEEVCTRTLLDGGKECIYASIYRNHWTELDYSGQNGRYTMGIYYSFYPLVPGSTPRNCAQTSFRILTETVERMFPEYEEDGVKKVDARRDAWFYDFENLRDNYADVTEGFAAPYKWREVYLETSGSDVGSLINFDVNKVWWRLADIILLRAESRVHTGDKAGAIEDLNTIRRRAGAKLYEPSENNGNLQYTVYKEREKELLMEMDRYYTVIRNGYWKTELYGNFRDVTDQDVMEGCFFAPIQDWVFDDNSLLRQTTFWLKRE